jgi:hypothetical protein
MGDYVVGHDFFLVIFIDRPSLVIKSKILDFDLFDQKVSKIKKCEAFGENYGAKRFCSFFNHLDFKHLLFPCFFLRRHLIV